MGLLKTSEEIGKIHRETFDGYDGKMMTFIWETKRYRFELLP